MTVKCFMVRPTHRFRLTMRRYSRADDCPSRFGYHNAHSPVLEVVTCAPDADGVFRGLPGDDRWPRTDPRWPTKCEHCAHRFDDSDYRQTFAEQILVDDAGTEYGRRSLPPGAMWLEDDEEDYLKGPDGRTLHVVCPDGWVWSPDHPCSNCTIPEDRGPFESHHRCWVRHGEAPNISVDKNGKTCKAGAGSIQTPKYHGFLRDGFFT